MSEHRNADLVARLLKQRLEGLAVPPPSPQERAQAVAALQHAMIWHRRQRRARMAGIFSVAAAVALIAGLAVLGHKSRPDAVPLLSGEGFGKGLTVLGKAGERTLMGRAALQTGERLLASDTGWGTVDLATGSHLVLERSSEVLIEQADKVQRFALARGSMRADVAKLHAGERFVITTGDSEVEVRGTSFRVWVMPPDPGCTVTSQTRVAVYEGVVRVRHGAGEVVLTRGSRWPQGCGEPGTAPAVGTPKISATTPAAPRPRLRPAAPAALAPVLEAPILEPAKPVATSTLAQQNQLFAGATSAARGGHVQAALEMYERLETRYPDGPLVESSMVERLRLLRGHNAESARELARRYLSKFPTGFARSEAQKLNPR